MLKLFLLWKFPPNTGILSLELQCHGQENVFLTQDSITLESASCTVGLFVLTFDKDMYVW